MVSEVHWKNGKYKNNCPPLQLSPMDRTPSMYSVGREKRLPARVHTQEDPLTFSLSMKIYKSRTFHTGYWTNACFSPSVLDALPANDSLIFLAMFFLGPASLPLLGVDCFLLENV
jgi:hypothetical protein